MKYEKDTWVKINYGFDHKLFYITSIFNNSLKLGSRGWMNSNTVTMTIEEAERDFRNIQVVGKAKKGWWSILNIDVICPYYKYRGS